MKCPRCQHENRPTARFCEDCANPLNGASPRTDSNEHPKTEVETLRRALTESLEQQTATAEILRVISSSPTDIQPVLDTVAASSARLCESYDSHIWRRDGDRLLLVAHHGPILIGPIGEFTLPLGRGTASGRAVLDGRTVQVADLQAAADEFPEGSGLARREGIRTILSVPLIRAGLGIGVIGLRRTEARPFTDRQIALLQTFADQAVIAIENVRLFTELQERNQALTAAHAQVTESLEQQTATSEILRVIASSSTDLQPVMKAVAESAARLCEATDAHVFQKKGDLLRVVASHGPLPLARQEVPISRQTIIGRAVSDRRSIHVDDLAVSVEDEFPEAQRMKEMGYRTILATPLLREGEPIGAIIIRRSEVRPFSSGQMALLATFADQAVRRRLGLDISWDVSLEDG